jgi:hypothetical protein
LASLQLVLFIFSSIPTPQEYVTLLTTNYRELEAAIAKALDGKGKYIKKKL